MIPFLVGAILAIAIAVLARILKFDKEPGFYSTVLIVVASYYVLFAFIARESIGIELLVAGVFSAVAIAGALRWPILLGLGILIHGLFDFAHSSLIDNSGVPLWWPAFCAGVDIVLGIWVIYLIKVRGMYVSSPTNQS